MRVCVGAGLRRLRLLLLRVEPHAPPAAMVAASLVLGEAGGGVCPLPPLVPPVWEAASRACGVREGRGEER